MRSKPKYNYLYGASVQGIQGFIFKTNKLKEIVGASELVEHICTQFFFEKILGIKSFSKDSIEKNLKCITAAAGNIKYLFDSEIDCKQVVRTFPMKVAKFAPGITVSQAVVRFEGDLQLEHFNSLEQKLKAQRNKTTVDTNKGLLITERSRRTGLPAVKYEKGNYIDAATKEKQDAVRRKDGEDANALSSRFTLAKKFFGDLHKYRESFQYDSNELSEKEEKSYIAVIHADGNNLGRIIQQIGKKLKTSGNSTLIKEAYKKFSIAIDKATQTAAQTAYSKIFNNYNTSDGRKVIVPFRPIILGGDDLTVICEAKNAVKFTQLFLIEFETQTKKQFETQLAEFKINDPEKLTACAGIAFVKNKFPFHYAINLAEELCSEAKKVSKEKDSQNAPSSLLFYKVESTFIDSYKQVKERVLTASGVNMQYGPYFTGTTQKPSVKSLLNQTSMLQGKDAPASHLRRWLSALNKSVDEADLLMKRTCEILELKKEKTNYIKELHLDQSIQDNKTHIHDIVALASISKQEEGIDND